MRVLVFLVLAVLSGCNASQPTKTRLDEVTEEIVKYAQDARDIYEQVLASDLGTQVSDELGKAATAVDKGLDKVWNQTPSRVKDLVNAATEKATEVLHSGYLFVQSNVEPVVEKVTPAAKAVANRLIIAYDNYNQIN